MERKPERMLTIEKIVSEFLKQPWCRGHNPFTKLSNLVELASLRLWCGEHSVLADAQYAASMLDQAALNGIVTNKVTGERSIRRHSNEPCVAYRNHQRQLKPLSICDAEIRLNDLRRAMKSKALEVPQPWISLKPEHRRKGGRKPDSLLLKVVTQAVQSLIEEKRTAPHSAVVQRLKIWARDTDSRLNVRKKTPGVNELYIDGDKLVATGDDDVEHARSFRSLERYTRVARHNLHRSSAQ